MQEEYKLLPKLVVLLQYTKKRPFLTHHLFKTLSNSYLILVAPFTMIFSKILSNHSSKEQITIKSVSDLSLSEQEQLLQLFRRYHPTSDETYIQGRVKVDVGFDLVVIQDKGKIQGVGYYNTHQMSTPFAKHPIPVVFFGQALKREGYKGDLIWKSGIHYAIRKIGWNFPFKKALGVSNVVNPRVYQKFQQLYPYSLNESPLLSDKALSNFINHYYQVECGLSFQVEEDMTCIFTNMSWEDITEDWERVYKAKDAAVNQLFFEKGILVQKKGKIYKTNKHLVTCGYRNVLQKHQLVLDYDKLNHFQSLPQPLKMKK